MLEAWGGQGGANAGGVVGGLGGYAKGTLAVTPGETLYIFVGGGGSTGAAGFFNGGGNAGTGSTAPNAVGGGGGGASDVRQAGSALANRVIVAGGGGGAGGNRVAAEGRGSGGGGGGGYYGGGGGAAWPQTSTTFSTGGTQSAGGTGGTSTYATAAPGNNGGDGALGQGGPGGTELPSNQAANQAGAVGGVGGGLTGGDGTYAGNFSGGSGAGGSSYIGGVTAASTTDGLRAGAGMVEITITQTLTAQTLTFDPAPTVVVNGSGNVNATSASPNSGNPITYSTTSTDCSVTSAGVVTGINAGTNNCVITATQAGNSSYLAGTETQTFSIGQASQTLTFGAAPTVAVNGTGNVSATSASPNSGNPITYSTVSTDCTVTPAGVVTGINAGTNNCVVTATQAGDANYLAGAAAQTFSIGQANQTLTFGAAPMVPVNGTGNVSATSASPNSGNPITYSTVSADCSVTPAGVVTGINAGTNNCVIAATQAGDANYFAGAATQTLSIGQANQTLTFGAAPTVAVNGTGNVSATSASPNSGNPITYSTMSTDCSVTSAGVVTGINAGSNNCTINATQAGNANYAAGNASQTFGIGQASQTLTFLTQSPTSQTFVASGTFPINPTATSASPNSSNAITYSSLTGGVCTVSGTTVTMQSVGVCTIAADQAGNANYSAATQVTQSVSLLGSGSVGGTVSGLVGSGLVLSLNSGAQTLPVSSNGGFAFPNALLQGASYTVTVQTPPSAPAQSCAVTNGSGTMGTTSVNNVSVTCATNAFPVSINLPAGVISSPSGTQIVAAGGTIAFTLTAARGFVITGASGCGGSLVGNVFTTGPINGDCTISVTAAAQAVQVPAASNWALHALAVLLLMASFAYLRQREQRIGSS